MFFGYITKEHTCPHCKSADVYRIKRRGLTIRAVCNVFRVRPHWCANCDAFFLAPKQPKEAQVDGPYRFTGGAGPGESGPRVENLPR